jgi:shikimate kinase
MRIALIGMAGSGKTYWSSRLEKRGFKRFCCDEMIAEKLEPELKKPDGSVLSVAEWMGFPHESRYQERQEQYLFLESRVLGRIIDYLEGESEEQQKKVVVDTTGSVIYVEEQLLRRLSRSTTMVLLETPSPVREVLLEAYLRHPHPLVWKGKFSQHRGESFREALARSYTDLFVSRAALYRTYAHVTATYDEVRRQDFGTEEFLDFLHAVIKNVPGRVL